MRLGWEIYPAVGLAMFAFVMWFLFLRAVPVKTAEGTIVSKVHRPSGTYWQYPAGLNRGFRSPTAISIPESYGFEIKVEGRQQPFRVGVNILAGKPFEVGQPVLILYQEKGIPPIWTKALVVDMKRKSPE